MDPLLEFRDRQKQLNVVTVKESVVGTEEGALWYAGGMCLVATYIHTDRVREKSMCGLCTTVSMVHIGREGGRKEGNSFSQAVLELG